MPAFFIALALSLHLPIPKTPASVDVPVVSSPAVIVEELAPAIVSSPPTTYLMLPLPPGTNTIPLGYSRPIRESREIWNYFAPDQSGRYRPRVIFIPEGAFDMTTGQPYPWTTSRPNDYRR